MNTPDHITSAHPGLLIAVEGIDGAGKSTLVQRLASHLKEKGWAVVQSKEPTNGPWGTQLRASAASGRLPAEKEVELLLRDRREHVNKLINPALARGEIVILDRYFPSMIAYQGAAGWPVDDLLRLNAFAPRPDLWLLLDLPVVSGRTRITARGDTPNHFENEANLQRCRAIFQQLNVPNRQLIDASHDEQAVFAQAWLAVSAVLEQHLPSLNQDRQSHPHG